MNLSAGRLGGSGWAAVLSLAALALLIGTPKAPEASAATVSFSYTGGEQQYTVPAAVHTVEVAAIGAAGGRVQILGYGGRGSRVVDSVAVTPGQVLYVEVGGQGWSYDSPGPCCTASFNGGGIGAAGGGGASDVRTVPRSAPGTTLASRLLVAGGGGGAGGYSVTAGGFPFPGGIGGDADLASPDSYNNGMWTVQRAGGVGSATSGGAGSGTGTAGTLGQGGDGGAGGIQGGGGGGGLYGGGGGAPAVGVDPPQGSGGGGGSSFSPHSVMPAPSVAAPSVTITPVPSPDATPNVAQLLFQDTPLGRLSDVRDVVVTNSGDAALQIRFPALTGPHATDFLIGSSTCGQPVAPSGTCTVSVRFAPSAMGPRTANLEIPSDDGAPPLVIALGGNGTAADTTTTAPVAPALSGLRLAPSRFRAAGGGASIAAGSTGTTITYTDTTAARATFTILRKTPGVRRGTSCVAAPTKRTAGQRRCTRLAAAGIFTRLDTTGLNTFRFTGRVRASNRLRTLSPGSYILKVVARLDSRSSAPIQTGFTVTA